MTCPFILAAPCNFSLPQIIPVLTLTCNCLMRHYSYILILGRTSWYILNCSLQPLAFRSALFCAIYKKILNTFVGIAWKIRCFYGKPKKSWPISCYIWKLTQTLNLIVMWNHTSFKMSRFTLKDNNFLSLYID